MSARHLRTEVIRARVDAGLKEQVAKIQADEDRTESDVVRILVEEALAARTTRNYPTRTGPLRSSPPYGPGMGPEPRSTQ